MCVQADPIDRLGQGTRDHVEAVMDRFRSGGHDPDGSGLRRDLQRIGFTDQEARRYVLMAIATQM